MNDIQLMRQARKLIESKDEEYICYALAKVSPKRSGHIKKWILQQLEGQPTYALWLMNTKGFDWVDVFSSYSKLRKGRIQWIDAMIEYLKQFPDHNLPR